MKTTFNLFHHYTEWKGNKCHPFKSGRLRLKGPKHLDTIWGLNLIVSSEKGISCSVLFCLQYIVGDNAKTFTSVGLSLKDVILF